VPRLQQYDAFHDADRAEIAIPPLHGMFLGVSVSAEQLDTGTADTHALLGGLLAGEPGLSGVGLALLRARGRTKHGQPHPLEFDRDIGDLERDTLAMADRLAERVSF